jgi:protein involved in polysaccharide export with SLBB domain
MRAGRTRKLGGWLLVLALVAGCGGSRGQMQQMILADHNPAAQARDLVVHYQVRYPDLLTLEVQGRPDCSGSRPVSLDGRISLTPHLHIVVDGLSTPQIAQDIAGRLGLPSTAVRVQVEKYASQHLYLFGEVGEKHHVVAYRGPETIVDLLKRIGGAAPGAALSDVHIVRAHVADGKPPEVFHVDLHAILTQRDLQTNVRLEPFDRIHVGQTRTTRMACFMPPWFRLFCKKAAKSEPARSPEPARSREAVADPGQLAHP